MKRPLHLFLLLLSALGALAAPATARPLKADPTSAYLFAYFTGNDIKEEAIRFALSTDGYHYRALNGNQPVVSSAAISETGGVRDPHIMRGDDGKTFYMVATDMVSAKGWSSNRGMVLLKSKDLVNWMHSTINFQKRYAGQENLKRVWAPQTIYDAQAKKYLVYFSLQHGSEPDKIYYAYANKDFTDLEGEPKQLFFSPTNGSCIDGDIVAKDGMFYLFFKTEGNGNGIKIAVSDKLTSGYVLRDPYVQQTKDPVEGAGTFKLNNSNDYILMYDLYTKGKYQFTRTSDLQHFAVVDKDISMDFHPRHGTVLPITAAEAARLAKRWPSGGNLGLAPPKKAEVLALITKVNDHWQAEHPAQVRSFWDHAAYQTGNMAAYAVTKNKKYRQYAEDWAVYNKWQGATSTDRDNWQYKYGETPDYVLFGDWQICFQTYADLYKIKREPIRIARAREVMEYEMSTQRNDYWWWADGLYMVMPVMTKLYNITKNPQYLDKLHQYFGYANSIMYDAETGLYYRDAKYVYPQHKSANGQKDFWARGDGWVFAGLAKVLADLPATDPHRAEYLTKYLGLAAALKKAQQPEGYWTRSLLDPAHAPGPETSGTAFNTYAYLWGINHGVLDKKEYLPTAQRGWQYLTGTALQPDGTVGYVQPIGEKAIPGQVVDKNSTANFGVGAFLLAASEMYHFTAKQ
ncbi:glycoside hydrolase family 88 protein [Hymenobacter bucti]|uniref:Glycoside hydrolase family 88 protein n=1 Tax=Hymenobacter bucti TaxID=1844114 RepID=A0ABW4QP46_9BACT